MQFSLIIPSPNFDLSSMDGTDRFPYRWRSSHFPALTIESTIANPSGKCCIVEPRIETGKNRERTKRYVSLLKFRILEIEKANAPTHKLEWIRDTGKFFYNNASSEFWAVFPGSDGGWLALIISKS